MRRSESPLTDCYIGPEKYDVLPVSIFFPYPPTPKVMALTLIDRWSIYDYEPDRLVNSLMHAVAGLPQLTDLDILVNKARIPLDIFANLSKLSIGRRCNEHLPSFISQMATVISNSPHLRSLEVTFLGLSSYGGPVPTLSSLFAKLSPENSLCLEHLRIWYMDATVDQVTLPHLKHLTSFHFRVRDEDISIARSVWNSFLASNIELSEVAIEGIVTEETMLYLSSCSGLKKLVLNYIKAPPDKTTDDLKNMLFTEVLRKHVGSLQTLEILRDGDNGWVKRIYYYSFFTLNRP
jgi:hypothetical protein